MQKKTKQTNRWRERELRLTGKYAGGEERSEFQFHTRSRNASKQKQRKYMKRLFPGEMHQQRVEKPRGNFSFDPEDSQAGLEGDKEKALLILAMASFKGTSSSTWLQILSYLYKST